MRTRVLGYMHLPRKPKVFYGYIIVLAAFCAMALALGANRTFGIFLEPMINEFGWTRAGISGTFTLCMIIAGLVGIVAGRLNDRFGPRLVLTACGFFVGLGYLLISQIGALWQLYLFYGVIVAIGLGGTFVPLTSTVARWFVKRRGLMTGTISAGPAFGIATVPLVASLLISSYGWRTSYIIIGIVVLVLVIPAAQFLRRDPSQMGLLPYGKDEVKIESLDLQAIELSLQGAIRTRQFWILSLVFFGCLFKTSVFMVHIVIYAVALGISPATAVTILSMAAGISIVGRIMLGVVADRIGNKSALIIGTSLTLVAFLWLLVAKELWMLYLFAVIFGLSGWHLSPVSPMIAELFGLRSHGEIFGVVNFGGMIGGAIGPLMAGYIFDLTGSYHLAFLVCVAISAIALILILLLTPTSNKGRASENEKPIRGKRA